MRQPPPMPFHGGHSPDPVRTTAIAAPVCFRDRMLNFMVVGDRAILWALAVLIIASLAALAVQISVVATVGSVGGLFASAIMSRVLWRRSYRAPAFFALAGAGLTGALAIVALRAVHLGAWLRIAYGVAAFIALLAEAHFLLGWWRNGPQASVGHEGQRSQ